MEDIIEEEISKKVTKKIQNLEKIYNKFCKQVDKVQSKYDMNKKDFDSLPSNKKMKVAQLMLKLKNI